jgi:hypothetical protein
MLLSSEHGLTIHRSQPRIGVCLREGQLVRDLNFLKCPVTGIFVIANPPAVGGQTDPKNRAGQESPASFLNMTRALQVEAVEEDVPGPEQSPRF